jgi:hypothetical protein
LTDTLGNLLERTATEGWLLDMYFHVTDKRAIVDAVDRMREHYADLATLTSVDLDKAKLAAGDCTNSKDLCALAVKVQADIQKVLDRYTALSKKPDKAIAEP